MEIQEWRFRRPLVLVPLPLQGHLNPMLQLGAILHSKGFSITIAHTHFNSPNPSNHPNFIFLPISVGFSSFTPFRDDFIAFLSILNTNFETPLRELLTQMIQKQGQDDKLPCIIYDGLMYCVAEITQSLKLPGIVLRTSCAANLLAYYAFPGLRNEGYLPVQGINVIKCELLMKQQSEISFLKFMLYATSEQSCRQLTPFMISTRFITIEHCAWISSPQIQGSSGS